MPKVKIWIYDDQGGVFPLDAEAKRESEYIVFENRTIKIKVLAEAILMVMSDEGHG